jgi:hypothetical protein
MVAKLQFELGHTGSHELGPAVERDTERFKLLFTNSRPEIPEGYSAPLCATPTRVMIARRVEELRSPKPAK